MAVNLGLRVIRRLCEQQNSYDWYQAKLGPSLFNPNEVPVFSWVEDHVRKHHALPHIETLAKKFPEVLDVDVPEPASYYVETLENQFFYRQIVNAGVESSKILKENINAWKPAADVLRQTLSKIALQEYRAKVMDFGAEASDLLLNTYHKKFDVVNISQFGWPYMDAMGGAMPGDVVSFIGRPQAGKSWMTLYTALHNWLTVKHNVLFVSMEMSHLPIAQRAAAMIAGTNLTQLKAGTYANFGPNSTYKQFVDSLAHVTSPVDAGGPRFYIVNGNLAADVEDIFMLADQLGCVTILIDGAYLCRNKNARLDRFTRAAENCEAMKRFCEEAQVACFSSWQFNRVATQKAKGKNGEQAGLEDIGYSDAIGQISSIVLGLFQDDGVETMNKKKIKVLKGRGGEVGEFDINWDFNDMNFDEVGVEAEKLSAEFI
jgi:replicative DNA helicase